MTDPTQQPATDDASEVSVAWGDKSARAKSKYMSEWLALLSLLIMCGTIIVGYYHMMDTRERDRIFMDTLKERDRDLKEIFKEANLTQRQMLAAQREQNCLIALPPDVREGRGTFCKTVAQ